MSRIYPIAYFNGSYLPVDKVCISPLDRGFLFADGVYEVVPVYGGEAFRLNQHLQRLAASLGAIGLQTEHDSDGFAELLAGLIGRNQFDDGALYLQITRGAPATRDHAYPQATEPTIYAHAFSMNPPKDDPVAAAIDTVTRPDIRWGACNIKSIALLANVMARQESWNDGAGETILVRDGNITEASASNVFIVESGALITTPRGTDILTGITRGVILELAAANAIECREERFSLQQMMDANELWVTSSTKEISPVRRVDGKTVRGAPDWPMWRRMSGLYQQAKSSLPAAS